MTAPNDPKKKIIAIDMDDTLLQGRFIDHCAQRFNFRQALELLRQIDRNPVSLTQRIASFLQDKRKTDLLEIADSIPLVPDAGEVVAVLKQRGYMIGIISDSYQVITEHIGKQINADFWLGNELVSEGDRFTGEVLIPSYFHYSEQSICRHQVCKTNALRYIAGKYDVPLTDCIAIGDSENDLCLLGHAGKGIAFCTTHESLRMVAQECIEERSFTQLLEWT